jgi:FG-GAP-like repeat
MSRAALAVAVVLGTVAAAVGCSAPAPCNPDTCSGCCTSSGRCTTGDGQAVCGRLGLACEDCGASATCSEQRCVESPVVPDAGSGDGGTACVPSFKGVQAATLVGAPRALTGPNNLALGDLDGDGKVDALAAYSGTGEAYVLKGNGDGTFTQKTAMSFVDPVIGVALGRLNGDGHLDAVLVSAKSTANVLINNGDGGFNTLVASPHLDLGGVALGDVDGDGHLDLITPVTELTAGDLWVNLGVGDGTFAAPTAVGTGEAVSFTAVDDLDRDGKLDFASLRLGVDLVSVVLRGAGGAFGQPATYSTGKAPRALALGLIDGDLYPDMVSVNSQSNSLTLRPNDFDGTFPVAATRATTNAPACVAIGDVTGDDKADVVVGGDKLDVFPGLGGGNLGVPTVFPTPASSIALADVDGNGRLDIVVLGPNRLTTYLRGCW